MKFFFVCAKCVNTRRAVHFLHVLYVSWSHWRNFSCNSPNIGPRNEVKSSSPLMVQLVCALLMILVLESKGREGVDVREDV